MAIYTLFMQPALGDLSEIDIPGNALRMLPAALAGLGQDGIVAPAVPVVQPKSGGATFSVDIQPFIGVVAGDDVSDQGSYLVVNTAVVNFGTPTAPGAGSRHHRLVWQVQDHKANGAWPAGTYTSAPYIAVDTSGVLPDLPPSSLDLAQIDIAAGQANVSAGNITQRYPVLFDMQPRGPWIKYQASAAPWNQTGSWVAFSAGAWPAVTFTVPPSGAVYVTVHAGVNSSGGGNTASIGFGISGTDSAAPTFGRCVSGQAVAIRASNRSLVTGLTPGATDTCTAYWHANGGSCTDTNDGHLIVEAV